MSAGQEAEPLPKLGWREMEALRDIATRQRRHWSLDGAYWSKTASMKKLAAHGLTKAVIGSAHHPAFAITALGRQRAAEVAEPQA